MAGVWLFSVVNGIVGGGKAKAGIVSTRLAGRCGRTKVRGTWRGCVAGEWH